MLQITFKEPEKLNRSVDKYFNNWYDKEWFNDPFVKEMVLDVDKTEIVGPNLAISPVFGAMPPTKISGGVKTLIMAWKTDRLVYGTACGDNCAKWLIEIGKRKDILVYLEHPMRFPDVFEAVCVDNDKEIHSYKDFIHYYLRMTDEYGNYDDEED